MGPIRAWPKRYYEVLSEDRLTVGTRGEYTAALLHDNEKIRSKLDKWISKFGFGKRIEFSQRSDNFFEVGFIDNSGQLTNIVDAGFGASQLLPLMVQSLAIRKDAIFVAEQPEIHLNPKIAGNACGSFR